MKRDDNMNFNFQMLLVFLLGIPYTSVSGIKMHAQS